jgi:hypothetical protein
VTRQRVDGGLTVQDRRTILITGAAGNLGSLLSRHGSASMIYAAAWLCECFATIGWTPSPLTRDFVRLGRVSHWGDTERARRELIPELLYPTLETGLSTL